MEEVPIDEPVKHYNYAIFDYKGKKPKKVKARMNKRKPKLIHKLYWRKYYMDADYVVGEFTYMGQPICCTYERTETEFPIESGIFTLEHKAYSEFDDLPIIQINDKRTLFTKKRMHHNTNNTNNIICCMAVGKYGEIINSVEGYMKLYDFLKKSGRRYFGGYVVDEIRNKYPKMDHGRKTT